MPPIAAFFPGYKRREETVSPLLLPSGNKATSVDPNVDTELEVTPEDLDPAVAQKAGRRAENDAIYHPLTCSGIGWSRNPSNMV